MDPAILTGLGIDLVFACIAWAIINKKLFGKNSIGDWRLSFILEVVAGIYRLNTYNYVPVLQSDGNSA